MARFEVFIPHAKPGVPDMTMRLIADSWIDALQAGRKRLGETSELGSNIMCDFADDGSVHVTDPVTSRVFSIRELDDQPAPAPQAAPQPQPKPQPPSPPPPPPPPPAAPRQPVQAPAPAPVQAPKPQPAPAPVKAAEEKKAPKSAPMPVAAPIPEQPMKVEMADAPTVAPKGPIGRPQEKGGDIEDILADIFQECMDLWNTCKTRQDVANFMLDLALKKIKAESGGFLYSKMGSTDLEFIAARGPKAADVMKFKVPLGKGIVGFCVQSGVSLAISDVKRDPRWYGTISKGTGYETKSLMCAVIQYDGQSLGAIELINRVGSSSFSVAEVNILNYIAHEAGEVLTGIADKEFVKTLG